MVAGMKKPALFLLLFALSVLMPHVGFAQQGTAKAAVKQDGGPVPVDGSDPTLGDAAAPVTMVVFTDLQCPFCSKLHEVVGELVTQYGSKKLRVVYKHQPLSMHKDARAAAEAAAAVWALEGDKGFFQFVGEAFTRLPGGQGGTVADVVKAVGADAGQIKKLLGGGKPGKKVDADIELADKVGVTGTPATFVNGIFLSGAQPKQKLEEVIDAQLKAAAEAVKSGVDAKDVYVTLAKKNFQPPEKRAPKKSADRDEKTVWKVPVGASPVRGPKDALVTLVVFSDFQCPYCGKLAPTLAELGKRYPTELRVVFKNNPLPFHKRAEPAAELAMQARAKKGDAGFWDAHDKIFAHQKELEDADLERYAGELGLDAKATLQAVTAQKHTAAIEADQELAEDLGADGTPTSFVNGRRLVGNQDVEKIAGVIDDEIVKAKALVQKGTPAARVYDAIMKGAQEPTLDLDKKTIAAPTRANPQKGPKGARVTIHMFTDFQCPFCGRVQETLADLEKEFPKDVRFVFHHRPLASHQGAMLAHEAAAEAFRQGGNAAFWKMHDKIYADQRSMDLAALTGYAKEIGLDVAAFEDALASGKHQKAIDAENKVAEDADIDGTPTFVINGWVLNGAQPLKKFRRVVKMALRGKK
jgi:protein-disulfide isomerase